MNTGRRLSGELRGRKDIPISLVNEAVYLEKMVKDLYNELNKKESPDSKLLSHIESTINISSGFVLAYCTQMYVIVPLINAGLINYNWGFTITSVFTVVSYVRSYCWRRFFANKLHEALVQWLRKRYRNGK